jgi:hypothetical protein
MGQTRDLGTRVELLSMDPHFHDITIGLYRQDHNGRPEYLVHTYSQREGACERIEFLRKAIKVLGKLEQADEWLYFSCASAHQAAARRAFLEACKLPPTTALEPRGLKAVDKRSGRTVTVTSLGGGRYKLTADGAEEAKVSRVEGVTAGLKKLAEMAPVEGSQDEVAFSCGRSHDALVGLLLPRALNVRAILREEEAAGGRGMLVAPSQQK